MTLNQQTAVIAAAAIFNAVVAMVSHTNLVNLYIAVLLAYALPWGLAVILEIGRKP